MVKLQTDGDGRDRSGYLKIKKACFLTFRGERCVRIDRSGFISG